MIDNIFNKIYKHKRYLPINETLNYDLKDAKIVEQKFQQIMKEINLYIDNSKNIHMAINNTRFVFYKSFGAYNQIVEKNENIESNIENQALEIYKQNNIKINSENELILHSLRNSNGKIINICPFIRLVIDTSNLSIWKEATVFYKLSKSTIDEQYIEKIYNKFYIYNYTFDEIVELLEESKNNCIDFINYKEQLNLSTDNNEFSPSNISDSIAPNESPSITVATNNTFRLYTKQLIADDRPRNIKNCTQMLLNSCEKLKVSLQSENIKTKIQSLKGINTPTILTKKDKEKYAIIADNAIQIIDTCEDAIKKAEQNDYNSDYTNSKGHNSDLQVYLPELLSPYALCYNSCKWTKLGTDDGYKILQKVVGSSGDNFLNVPCFIGYYDDSGAPLADSFAWINGKFIDISTKAGSNGQGAPASIESLRKYIFKTDINNNVTTDLTPKGQICKKVYPMEFEIFDHLTTDKKATATTVKNILVKYNLWSPKKPVKKDSEINNFLKHQTKFTALIMEILQSASYDFVQMNCKPTSSNSDFHFEYTCQYPAIFDGEVDIIFTAENKGFTKFHIV